jgi:hypothetical protein
MAALAALGIPAVPDGIQRLGRSGGNRARQARQPTVADVGWRPATPCQMVNEGLRLWGYQFLYDASELKRILEEAGFRE